MNTNTITSPSFEVISRHAFGDVLLNTSTRQKCLSATRSIQRGETLCRFHAGSTQSFATYLTVQTGKDTHITLQPEFLQYINHSCEPNVFFDTTNMELVCLKTVGPGDELTFFYPSTEWDMAQPFVCNCGSKKCLQLINGASHLSAKTLKQYQLTDFIKQQLKQMQPS
jgi:hypothetical protein